MSKKQTVDVGIQVNMDEYELQMRGGKIKLENVKKIIFSGGFLKGYSFIGCINYLIENNIDKQINTIIGSSIGSLVGLLFVLDYSIEELEKIDLNFNKYVNITTENVINFTETFGLDDGKKIIHFFKNIIYYKTSNYNITFKQLYELNKKTFVVTGTNLKKRKTEFFSHITTPNMPIWIAIRISTSYPIFYNIVEYENKKYFDGAASSHCSIEFIEEIIKETIDDTLCISISKLNNFTEKEDNNLIKQDEIEHYGFFNYIMDMCGSLRYRDLKRLDKYSYNLLEIDCDINSFRENIKKEEIIQLINIGYNQIKAFF